MALMVRAALPKCIPFVFLVPTCKLFATLDVVQCIYSSFLFATSVIARCDMHHDAGSMCPL